MIVIRNASFDGRVSDILIENGLIVAIDNHIDNSYGAEEFDAEGLVTWPGMVNTHHHLAQSILKGMPAGINADLNSWLSAVPFAAWPYYDPDTLYVAALLGLAELMRSGCTTCADHHYFYQANQSQEMEAALLQAADEVGIRFVLCRGGATSAGSHLGLNSSNIRVEGLNTMLDRLQLTLDSWHDPSPNSMRRLVVAPTSLIHSSEPEHLRVLGEFARANHLKRHSHLLEVRRDEQIAQDKYGKSAVAFAEEIGWLGEDTWYAHVIHTDNEMRERLAESSTGIAHCPTSNCRLGSGIAHVPDMADLGIPISIGVDGAASAESGSMTNEAMQTWLLHRVLGNPSSTTLAQVQGWCTAGGADLLGLNTGRISVGACADLVFFDVSAPRYAGVWMLEYAPILCGEPVKVSRSMINGRWRLIDGELIGVDERKISTDARKRLRLLQKKMSEE